MLSVCEDSDEKDDLQEEHSVHARGNCQAEASINEVFLVDFSPEA